MLVIIYALILSVKAAGFYDPLEYLLKCYLPPENLMNFIDNNPGTFDDAIQYLAKVKLEDDRVWPGHREWLLYSHTIHQSVYPDKNYQQELTSKLEFDRKQEVVLFLTSASKFNWSREFGINFFKRIKIIFLFPEDQDRLLKFKPFQDFVSQFINLHDLSRTDFRELIEFRPFFMTYFLVNQTGKLWLLQLEPEYCPYSDEQLVLLLSLPSSRLLYIRRPFPILSDKAKTLLSFQVAKDRRLNRSFFIAATSEKTREWAYEEIRYFDWMTVHQDDPFFTALASNNLETTYSLMSQSLGTGDLDLALDIGHLLVRRGGPIPWFQKAVSLLLDQKAFRQLEELINVYSFFLLDHKVQDLIDLDPSLDVLLHDRIFGPNQ